MGSVGGTRVKWLLGGGARIKRPELLPVSEGHISVQASLINQSIMGGILLFNFFWWRGFFFNDSTLGVMFYYGIITLTRNCW